MSSELKVFRDNPSITIATWRDIVISIFRTNLEAGELKAAEQAQTEMMKQFPRYGTLAVAEKTAMRISAEARKEAERITALGRDSCCAIALVIGVEGFAGAAIRAAITGIHLITGSKMPQKSFAAVPTAVSWLFERLRHDPAGAAAFAATVDALRAPR